MRETLFHLAFPVSNLEETKIFYQDQLGCELGRESKHSLIFNLGGHQIVAQLTSEPLTHQRGIYPRHLGLIFLEFKEWEAFLNRAQKHQLLFFQEAKVRYPNTPLEHHTFFLKDPSFNLLEFKFYKNRSAIFGETSFQAVGDAR